MNPQNEKTKMAEQRPDIRRNNFLEVALGYSKEEAVNESTRCLGCKNAPCMAGCPVGVNIPKFIQCIAEEDFIGAYDVITETNALPAVCGRVCPQESQCEKFCVRAKKGESVAIGNLERFASKFQSGSSNIVPSTEARRREGKPSLKAAVIGSGPASLTCASDLLKYGYAVDIFEALHHAGGVLTYGIPEFRLPKRIISNEIDQLKARGARIHTNVFIGKTLTIDELFGEGYSAVFIGSGAGLPKFMGIPGEHLGNVFSANEYLTRINLMKAYNDDYDTPVTLSKNVAVIGGGNVAMDAARCAVRLGTENVFIVYRRSESEMPARLEEAHHAKEEGVVFHTLHNPVRILGDENGLVSAIELVEMTLAEPDESGRRRPIELPDSNTLLSVDTVIIAIGTAPGTMIRKTTRGLSTLQNGCIQVAEDGVSTSVEGVFAGGDAVSGAATVILAMGAGKKAAEAMHNYMANKINKTKFRKDA